MPDSSFTVADVARVVGEDKAIRPIHVGEQANIDQVGLGLSHPPPHRLRADEESALGIPAAVASLAKRRGFAFLLKVWPWPFVMLST